MLPVIRSVVSSVLPGLFNVPATLHVYAEGTLTTPSTYTSHVLDRACFVDSKRVDLRQGGLLEADQQAVLFYTDQLPAGVVLKADDEVTVTDKLGTDKRYKLVRLAERDPAEATETWGVVDS